MVYLHNGEILPRARLMLNTGLEDVILGPTPLRCNVIMILNIACKIQFGKFQNIVHRPIPSLWVSPTLPCLFLPPLREV